MLSWSRYCQPQIVHGRRPLVPSNMAPSPDRLAHLAGILEAAELLRSTGASRARLEGWLSAVPLARRLVALEDGDPPRIRPRPEARALLSFDPALLGVAILDGRHRPRRGTTYLATGTATPRVAELCQALARGASWAELAELAPEPGLLDTLRARGQLEDRPPSPPPPRPAADRVTWLGHAAVVVETPERCVWIDPFLVPQIRWTTEDESQLFTSGLAEERLFEARGTAIQPRLLSSLPPPDLVLLTHQDRDHVDLGLLACLPDSAEIVVPRADPARPWEVDLARLVRQVLGTRRRVRILAQGEVLASGDLSVEALPFRGEMPAALPHSWNTYLLTTPRHRVALLADSRLEPTEVEALAAHHRRAPRPLFLFAGTPRAHDWMPGWREGLDSIEVHGLERLWGFYVPPAALFTPTRCANLTGADLAALRAHAGLVGYFPYAMGSAPWFRFTSPADAFHLPVSSLSLRELEEIAGVAARAQVPLLPLRHGRALDLEKELTRGGVSSCGELSRAPRAAESAA